MSWPILRYESSPGICVLQAMNTLAKKLLGSLVAREASVVTKTHTQHTEARSKHTRVSVWNSTDDIHMLSRDPQTPLTGPSNFVSASSRREECATSHTKSALNQCTYRPCLVQSTKARRLTALCLCMLLLGFPVPLRFPVPLGFPLPLGFPVSLGFPVPIGFPVTSWLPCA